MRFLGLILWASMLVAGFTARVAHAQANRRVVLIQTPTTDDIRTQALTRVHGELSAAGFDVVVVEGNDDVLFAAELAVRDLQALAAFAIFPPAPPPSEESGVRVLFSDAAKGRTLLQRMPVDRQRSDEAKVLAVRMVELLKANLAEFWLQPDRVLALPGAVPLPRVEPAPSSPARAPLAGFGVEAGLGVIQQFHELGASVMPVLKLSLAGQLGIGARLCVGGLGSSSTAGATFGLARVQQQFGAGDLFFAFPRQRAFQWLVSGGAGVLHVRVEGDGFSPYQGRTTQTWSALAKAGWGAAVTLAPKLALAAELEGLVAFSPTRVLVGEAEVGRMGSPALLFSVGIVGVF